MIKPIFKNKANQEQKLVNGQTIWLSRSVAVVAIIFVIYDDQIFVLAEKRSSIMEEPNKWALISGYLDWFESGYDGIVRETFEETSFYIPKFEKKLIFDNDKQPFYVHSDPITDDKQNVSLTYIFIYKFEKLPMEIESYKDKEIDQIKWMPVEELFKYEWAFNHNDRINMALIKYKNKIK